MSVYQRTAKGPFYMNFTVDGVRVFRSTGKYTKKEAKAVEAEERRKLIKSSKKPVAKVIKLAEAIEQVYEHRWMHNKDAEGSYKRASRLLIFLGDIPLPDISEQIVQQLQKRLDTNKLSIATVNRYLATLKTILKYHHLPTHFIRLRKERNGRIRVISREEEQQICSLLRNQDNYFPEVADLVEVLLDTGLRLSEALNLDFKDISFKNNLISIWVNKGDKPRSIPMTKRVRQLLQDKEGEQKPFNLTVNQCEYAWSIVRAQMELEGDKEFVIHSTRHTTASRMVSAGVDLYVVKEILGHSSIQVTERYAHLAPGKLVTAIEVLEASSSISMDI